MSKRNIAYVKPQEPSFIRKLKEQIGYKEGPTVDTKREELLPAEDFEDRSEEEPVVVVLQAGDLTAEEAAKIRDDQNKDSTQEPADLNKRIVFKAPDKSQGEVKGKKRASSEKQNKPDGKKQKNKPLLSFDHEEDCD